MDAGRVLHWDGSGMGCPHIKEPQAELSHAKAELRNGGR